MNEKGQEERRLREGLGKDRGGLTALEPGTADRTSGSKGAPGRSEPCLCRKEKGCLTKKTCRALGQILPTSRMGSRHSCSSCISPGPPPTPKLALSSVSQEESLLIKVNHSFYASPGLWKYTAKGPRCAHLPIFQS